MNRVEAMEDALKNVILYLGRIIPTKQELELKHKAEAALAFPRRQCDVGTPDEHDRRWRSNCGSGIPGCSKCAVYAEAKKLGLVNHRYLMKSDCKFVWAQMPYTEKGGAE